jgi:hypothetical protein
MVADIVGHLGGEMVTRISLWRITFVPVDDMMNARSDEHPQPAGRQC